MTLRFAHRKPAIVLAAILLCLWVATGETAGQENPESRIAPVPAPTGGIPLAEVATSAAEVPNFLQALNTQLVPSPVIQTIRKELPKLGGQIDGEIWETSKILQEQPTLEMLQAQQKLWQGRQTLSTGWLQVLTKRAIHLRDALNRLKALEDTWAETRNGAQASNAPEQVLQQINGVLADIESARGPLEGEHRDVLDLQAGVSREVARCESALVQVTQAQQKAMGGIFKRDGLPFWSDELWAHARSTLGGRVHEIASGWWEDIQEYLHNPSRGLPLHVGLFMVFTLLFYAARRQVHLWAATAEDSLSITRVFNRPYATALLGALLVATATISTAPPTVQGLMEIVAVVLMIRLVQPVLNPRVLPMLCVVGSFFILNQVGEAFSPAPLVEQAILLFEMVAGIALVVGTLAVGRPFRTALPVKDLAPHTVQLLGGLFLLGLAVGLVAGLLGYMRLARLLASGLFGFGVLVLWLYVLLQVLMGLVAFTVSIWPLRQLKMVQYHRNLLVRRANRLMVWLAIGTGLLRSLDHVGLLQSTLSFGGVVLATKLERGAISISLEDVLAFVVTVWATFLLSAFIRFVLREEVYPRMGVSLGISYATSSLLNYVILALGFVVGLGVLGVDLTKVTVLAGALGVGIGLGLQSVVNNFVCGVILLFERPIHVGDTLEVGDLLGEVRRIGIRASTIHTRQGADIIVPNAQLVTDKVTNWTLSDRLRRIELPVGVSYGAAPEKVIEILESVARTHPRVVKKPAPHGLFVGFGDSSINFELRAWTDQFEDWPLIRSELATSVYNALQEAGMSFPFPQREVRLLNLPGTDEPVGEVSTPSKMRA